MSTTNLNTQVRAIATAPLVVAAFDLDGTLTEGGSVFGWLCAVAGRWRATFEVTRIAPRMLWAAIAGGSAADATKERLFTAVLGGAEADHVRAVSHEYAARHYRKHLRPVVKRQLEWHRSLGHRIVIVSASPEAYVRPLGHLLGVDEVLATRLEVDNDERLTGHYEGLNCRGFEKYSRLASWLRTTGVGDAPRSQPTLVAYGNSRGDLRLLRAADLGVNCGRLGPVSRLRSYPSIDAVAQAISPSAP